MPKKKLPLRKARQKRDTNSKPKQSPARKVVKSDASKRATRYQNTLRALKGKYGIDHATAQRSYHELTQRIGKTGISRVDVARHPRITKRAIEDGKKSLLKSKREKLQRSESRSNNQKIIEQAIRELEINGPGIRRAITETSYDKAGALVKITIRGKDYTTKIHGHITDRKGSKILAWKWKTQHQGRRKRRR
jgi:hypothetical protein